MWICSSVQRVFVCVLPVLFRVKKTSFDSCGLKKNIFMHFFHVRNIRMLSSCKHQHAQAPVGSSGSRSQGWKGGVVVKLGPFARCADLSWPSHRGQRSPLRGCVRLCVNGKGSSAALLNSPVSATNRPQTPFANTSETSEQQRVWCRAQIRGSRGVQQGCVCVQREGGKTGYCLRVITWPQRMTLRSVFVRNSTELIIVLNLYFFVRLY